MAVPLEAFVMCIELQPPVL
ncbi:TPA: DUF1196 domain-containing protein [Vibrio vulnificus]|nr:DUF1196 domain-containing protein [Vibrio cholerae]HAS8304137.1 DUF1196 domain-containing protein [Vibrio vulnificus]